MKKILKNSIKILLFLIFLFGVCSLIPIKPNAEQIVAQKGDLRCSLSSGSSCKEELVNGKVQSVTLRQTTAEGIVVEKKVSRTDKVGTYNVQFYVKGKVDMMPKADIFFVLDASRSMIKHYRGVYSEVQRLTARSEIYDISGFNVSLDTLYNSKYLKVGFASFAGSDIKPAVFDKKFEKNENTYVLDESVVEDVLKNKPLASRGLMNEDLSSIDGRDNCLYRVNDVCQWWCKKTTTTTKKNNKVETTEYKFANTKADVLKLGCDSGNKNNGMLAFVGSPLYIGLNSVLNSYSNSTNLEHSYVIVLGDGGYQDKEYTDSKEKIKELKEKGIKIYAVNYAGDECKYGEKKDGYTKCSEQIMKDFSSGEEYYKSTQLDTNAIATVFKEIISNILKSSLVGVSVKDTIGNVFGGGVLEVSINSLGNIEAYSEVRSISINNNAETGWHKTNEEFEVVYTLNGKIIDNKYEKELQPEVYWIKEKGWESCSDTASSSGMSTLSYEDIIVRNCQQAPITDPRNGESIPGIRATLITNNLSPATNSFGIGNYIGVPSNIQIKSSLICNYTFNYDAYMKKRTDLINAINDNGKSEQERWDAKNELNSLAQIADTIANDLSEQRSFRYDSGWPYPKPLEDYENKLRNDLSGTLIIKYWSLPGVIDEYHYKKSYEEYHLHTYNNDGSSINWFSGISIPISYFDNAELTNFVTVNKTVYNNVNTSLISTINMELEESCLSPKNGNATTCDTNQINGGSNFYVRKEENSGGFISVTLKNATFSGADIKLEGDKKSKNDIYDCTFSVSDSKPIFRQIELADPFIQVNTNKTRAIGKNWSNLNRNYYFVNIIKSDLWENETTYQYKFDISKDNIKNIKNNTAEEGVNSYLGRDCKFGSDNNYTCDFIRNTSEKGNSYFTKIY